MPSSRVPGARPTFLYSDRRLARAAQPITRFLHIEAAGGIMMLVATVVALVWANSGWSDSYHALWSTEIRVQVGSYVFEEDLGHLVNDLLMAVFFFVVGMEIKRELVVGQLRDPRAVALPVIAAFGGMVVPALIYTAFNVGGPGAHGWGIPMATDIAFALGVVAVLGSSVPSPVKVILLTLAIVDDLGGIAVIAIFYASGVDVLMLLVAVGVGLVVTAMHRVNVVYPPVLLASGLVLWLAVYESGVHATIAGVAMGLLTPARPMQTELEAEAIVNVLEGKHDLRATDIRATASAIKGSISPCDRLIDLLHPWTAYVIVPIFALANTGIVLSSDAIGGSAVFNGVVAGLVVGKLVGVFGFSRLAVATGLGRLPAGVTWVHMAGMATVAGIGFTVSIFITSLAFEDGALQDQAKAGTLTASIIAAVAGATVFAVAARTARIVTVASRRSEAG